MNASPIPSSEPANASADATALVIGLPKGSLQKATIELFAAAGYRISISDRSYYPQIDESAFSCVMFRAQEMARYVQEGVVDVGITGHDWVVESEADVHEVCELEYARASGKHVSWVLAVPDESPAKVPADLDGGIIATELLNTTRAYFEKLGINVKVEFSWGATEVKARMLSGIVDVTETGSSIRANKLRVIDTLLTSTTRLVANRQAWADPAKRRRIEDLAVLLRGAMAARSRVGLKLNVPRGRLGEAIAVFADRLNEGQSPTVNDLADSDWAAMEVIVDRTVERDLIPALRRVGARAIVSFPLNSVIE